MVQSEVRRARERHAANRPSAVPVKQDLVRRINAALPAVATALKQHDFPEFANKAYAAGLAKVDGQTRDVWTFRSGINYTPDHRVVGGLRENGYAELGVLLQESAGVVTGAVVIGSQTSLDRNFRIYGDADLMKLEPFRLNALLQVLLKLQEEPSAPVWDMPDL